MRVPTKTMAGLSALGLSMMLLGSSPAAAADTQSVSKISGSQTCPSGYYVYIQAWSNGPSMTLAVNGRAKISDNFVIAYNTKLRTATWNVSGASLATASDSCVKSDFSGGGGGGNFSLDPQSSKGN